MRSGGAVLIGVAVAACGKGPARDRAAACLDAPPERRGEATYYDADGAGNCSFDPGGDLMVAAINGADYDGGAWCGGCVEVDGPAGNVNVRIVDQCPGCASGDLDLSREAFARIADLGQGRVPITWREAPCDVTGPIRYRFKDGSNPFWTGVQIRNHRYPIASVAARLGDGTWRAIGRASYNYFVDAAGLGPGPYTLRVTDDRGHVLDDVGIAFAEATEIPGAAQLPACPP
jgi:expansin (peptidoglycan-binding protein)